MRGEAAPDIVALIPATGGTAPRRKLRQEQRIASVPALQPADLGTIADDDADLRRVPLPAEARDLCGRLRFSSRIVGATSAK
jgi:hypothetical protein